MGDRQEQDQTVVWGNKVSKEFRAAVIAMARRLGTRPDYLMAIMAFETGATFDPAQHNLAHPQSGPVGLIQFTSVAAGAIGTSKAELVKMTAEQQLVYVEKFLMLSKDHGLGKLEDLYAAVHFPAAVGKPVDYVLYAKDSKRKDLVTYYNQNSGFDANHDGKVTLKEAAAKVWQKLAEGEAYRE